MRKFILLTEIHHVQSLLLESRVDFLKSKYQAPLVAKLNSGSIPSEIKAQVASGSQIDPDKAFDLFANADPDKTKKNLQWLLMTYLAGRMQIEDLEKATDYLTRYAEKKKARELTPDQMDLNRFKSLGELFAAIKGSDTQIIAAKDAEYDKAISQSDVIYDGPEGLIISPKTEFAAQYFGRDTEWCTAYGDPKGRYLTRTNQFGYYNERGPLYIIIGVDGTKYQFHFEERQFMDVNDNQIPHTKLMKMRSDHPLISKLFKWYENQIKDDPKNAYGYAECVLEKRFPEAEKSIITDPLYAYYYARDVIRDRFPEGEKAIASDPKSAYFYARDVIDGRFPEGEDAIATSQNYAANYAKNVIECRFPEGEKAIGATPQSAYEYAREVVRGPFIEGEKAIATNPTYSYRYAKDIIKGRFPKGEKAIATDPDCAYWYAKYIIKGRFPEGETAIASNPEYAFYYTTNIIKGRFPKGESTIASNPRNAYEYARKIINGRFPEGEKTITNDPCWAYEYARKIINGRFPEGEEAIATDPYYLQKYKDFISNL